MRCTNPFFEILRKKWSIFILEGLTQNKSMNFSQLLAYLKPLTSKSLIENIQSLLNLKMIDKKILTRTPLRVSYTITTKGKKMVQLIKQIKKKSDQQDTLSNCQKKICVDCFKTSSTPPPTIINNACFYLIQHLPSFNLTISPFFAEN